METITREEAAKQGLKKFFSGKACVRGHVSERFVSSGGCIDCTTITNRKTRRKLKRLIREARAQSAVPAAEQTGG